MQGCGVFMRGRDRRMHLLKVKASSVMDAAAKALQTWASADWYSDEEVIEICSEGKLWRVPPGRVMRWLNRHVNPCIQRGPEQSQFLFN